MPLCVMQRVQKKACLFLSNSHFYSTFVTLLYRTYRPENKRLRELCLSVCAAEAKNVRGTYHGNYDYIGFAASETLEIFVRDIEEKLNNGTLACLKVRIHDFISLIL